MAKRIDVAKAMVRVAHPNSIYSEGYICVDYGMGDVISDVNSVDEESAWVQAVYHMYEINLEKCGFFSDAGWP